MTRQARPFESESRPATTEAITLGSRVTGFVGEIPTSACSVCCAISVATITASKCDHCESPIAIREMPTDSAISSIALQSRLLGVLKVIDAEGDAEVRPPAGAEGQR